MITSLRIKGFKCFSDTELSHLSRITLLGGRNNVGKTAVLEAVFMFLDRANPNMLNRQYAARGVAALPLIPEAVFQPIFARYDLKSEISIAADIDGAEEEMVVRYNPSYDLASIFAQPAPDGTAGPPVIRTDRPPEPSVALDIAYRRDGAHVSAHLAITREGLMAHGQRSGHAPPPAAFIWSRMRTNPNEVAGRFGQLDVRGERLAVLRFLNTIEPNLTDISTVLVGDSALVHGDVALGRKIPIAYMGDGVARLLDMAVFIATTPKGVVLVDEVENGIHHSVMAKVWRGIAEAAREFDCQVIATTHSFECVQAAWEGLGADLAADLTYIRLDREGERISAKTYDSQLLETALKSGLEIR